MPRTDLDRAIEQIAFARNYTVRLLRHTDPAEWFRQPAGGVSHIAWQVGHLAMAEYRLVLGRVRGPRPGDKELIAPEFLRAFGRESVPDPAPERYPAPAEIRAVFDRVHEQVLRDLPGLADADLDAPLLTPHALCSTKRAALFWCAQHEMLHAGQIGLLRRLLGHPPLW
jgi:hypothetical protein